MRVILVARICRDELSVWLATTLSRDATSGHDQFLLDADLVACGCCATWVLIVVFFPSRFAFSFSA